MGGVCYVVALCMALASAAAFMPALVPTQQGVQQQRTPRGQRGQLQMAKHVQWKATKKHVKTRPRKSRASDRNRKPAVYDEVVMTNGACLGIPVYTVTGHLPPKVKPVKEVVKLTRNQKMALSRARTDRGEMKPKEEAQAPVVAETVLDEVAAKEEEAEAVVPDVVA